MTFSFGRLQVNLYDFRVYVTYGEYTRGDSQRSNSVWVCP